MEFFDSLSQGFAALATWQIAWSLLLGSALGIAVGVLPGVGPGVTIAVLLPFTYGMAPLAGISLLLGVYCGAFYGGAVTSILIRTPGEASSIMTMFDGYPMARHGQAQRALSLAFMSAFIGGIGSALLLGLAARPLAGFAAKFGAPESVMAILLAAVCVGKAYKRQFASAMMMMCLGFFLATVGIDPNSNEQRYTLGLQGLLSGIPLVPVAVGMFGMAQALARVARRRGAVFRYHSTCERIEQRQGRVCGVHLQSGEFLPADRVIFNGDASALRQGLLGDDVRRAVPQAAPQRSLSALTWSMHTPTEGVALDRHNVFFQSTYASEFEDIFERQRLPQQPTVYVCAQDRPGQLPHGQAERLFCLVNAPACGDGSAITEEALEQCQTHTFQHLRQLGLHLQPTASNSLRTTPQDFHRRFPASGGALYGQATHGWTSIFSRPGSTTPLQGLYLAGGSVHPGPGVPMAALSGQRAAEALMASLASTSTFPTGATCGGMSTP